MQSRSAPSVQSRLRSPASGRLASLALPLLLGLLPAAGSAWAAAGNGAAGAVGAVETMRGDTGAGEPSSWLGTPAGKLQLTYQRWTYPDLSGGGDHQLTQPLDLLLFGDLRGIARRELRLSLLGRVERDLEQSDTLSGALLVGYLEALRLGGLVDLWAGRRVPLDGSTTGALDGVWVDLAGLPWFGVGLHAGRPVSFVEQDDLPELSLGAHAWLHGLPWTHLELRYERQEDSPFSTPLRHRVGGEALLALRDDWVAFASADYETRSETLERGRAGLRYRAAGPWRGGVEGFRYDPWFTPGSVFARLPSDPHWGASARLERALGRRFSLGARWTTRVFQRRELGASEAGDRLVADPVHEADLDASWQLLPSLALEASGGTVSGEEGASLLASLAVDWRYRPLGLQLQAGGYLNAHDRRFGDPSGILELFGETAGGIQRNLARGLWLDLGATPIGPLSFGVRGEGFQDESAQRSVRLLARLTGALYQ